MLSSRLYPPAKIACPNSDKVTIHYVGTLLDGTRVGISEHLYLPVPTLSKRSNDAFVTEIGVGKVIKGWDEGTLHISFLPLIMKSGVPQLS